MHSAYKIIAIIVPLGNWAGVNMISTPS